MVKGKLTKSQRVAEFEIAYAKTTCVQNMLQNSILKNLVTSDNNSPIWKGWW